MFYWYFHEMHMVIPFIDCKGITMNNAFKKFLDKSNRKTNKIWEDKGIKAANFVIDQWNHVFNT